MDRVFLDANVLFSAAYQEASGLQRLWKLDGVEPMTSMYALEEAGRNLTTVEQRRRLFELSISTVIVPEATLDSHFPDKVSLPKKDQPILLAAIAAGATHLLTGDRTHFGKYYGHKIGGVLLLRPADYLKTRTHRS